MLFTKDTAPALFPAVVLFVVFPVIYYTSNAEELADTFYAFAFFGIAFLITCALSYSLLFFKESRRNIVVKILFALGVYMLLADLMAPSPGGQLITGTELENIDQPLWVSIAQTALLVGLLALAIKAKWNEERKRLASFAVAVVFISQLVQVGFFIVTDSTNKVSKSDNTRKHTPASSNRGNIYHVVFDSYGEGFTEHANELGVFDQFEGFTNFEETLTNSDYTQLSLPSFMSGTLITDGFKNFSNGKRKLERWRRAWMRGIGIMDELKKNGFTINDYQQRFLDGFLDADYHVDRRNYKGVQNESVSFIDHVFLRATPNILRHKVMVGGQGWTSRFVTWFDFNNDAKGSCRYPDQAHKLLHGNYSWGPTALALFRQLMRDESKRSTMNQYCFIHILLPHSPYNIDRDLEIRGIQTSWHEQALACVNLMCQFIHQLKASGKYETAAIIFQGDHGEEFKKGQSREDLPRHLKKKVKTLLLIKPPFAQGKIGVSKYPAQLLDVAPTIYAIAGIKKNSEGVDLFSENKPQERDRRIFTFRKLPESDKCGAIHMVTLTADNKWKVKEDIILLR